MPKTTGVDSAGSCRASSGIEASRWPYIPEWITASPWEGLYDVGAELAAELALSGE